MSLIIVSGVVIGFYKPIFVANSWEVVFKRNRLDKTDPKEPATDWTILVFLGHLIYLIDKLSKEISWIVINTYENMRTKAKNEA